MARMTYYTYIRPQISIGEQDLTGKVSHVTLSVIEDAEESWQVSLDGVAEDAMAILHDMRAKGGTVELVVEQTDPEDHRDPSFSGYVFVHKLSVVSVELHGSGPLKFKPR
jgi:hypothetical protein